MPSKSEIIEYINKLLNIAEFDDYSVNGLQVEGKEQISKIILGVSCSERLFTEAVKRNADMILVHHGLFWKKTSTPFTLTGFTRNRIALLIENNINLAAYHLPLDAHPEIGNNAQILKRLKLKPIKPIEVGFLGKLEAPVPIDNFIKLVNKQLQTDSELFLFGSKKVSQVLVISGSSAIAYPLALKIFADTFIAGNIKESLVRELEEVKLNLINAGHYNTEKFGVQALGKVLERQFELTCEFVDIPNPV